MMLTHFAEPKPPHGGIAAEGALNLLGRPSLDPLAVLVRETVQNSWDARAGVKRPVEVTFAFSTVKDSVSAVLLRDVFGELPPKGLFGGAPPEGRLELEDALEDGELQLLTVTDKGTKGLGGPIRADRPIDPGEPSDFVDFVFNIGARSNRTLGGGTYGFGKTIAYLVSRCHTIIIGTRTTGDRGPETRLIAQSIGANYSRYRQNYTGRHWWGSQQRQVVEPVTGRRAEKLSDRLELPGFGRGNGTTLVILAPALGDRSLREAAEFVAEALLWNFWPKMVGDDGGVPSMRFRVTCEGKSVVVPSPMHTPPFDAYARALSAVRDCDAGRATSDAFPDLHIHEIRAERPSVHLGWLAMGACLASHSVSTEPGEQDVAPITAGHYTGPPHHVALMRQAELVVEYKMGPDLPTSTLGWAGVFKAAKDADKAFAMSEPPTHDDWRPDLLPERRQRTLVNVALREIRNLTRETFGGLGGVQGIPRSDGPAAIVGDALGGLIAPTPGTGVARKPQRPVERNGRRKGGGYEPRITTRGTRLGIRDGLEVLYVDFAVSTSPSGHPTQVDARAMVATPDGGGIEDEPPVGADVASVLGFQTPSGDFTTGRLVSVPADDDGVWTVIVKVPAGAATAVDLTSKRDPD